MLRKNPIVFDWMPKSKNLIYILSRLASDHFRMSGGFDSIKGLCIP